MTLTIDSERAQQIVVRLYDAFSSRFGLLSETEDLVENQIPPNVPRLSRDHSLFLFFTVANDHGMKSSRLYAAAKQLFQKCRELFEPRRIVADFSSGDDPALIEATAKSLGVRYPREAARSWYANSLRLLESFNGDPRQLFQSSSDASALLKQIRSFRGYGPKTGGMLLRAIVGLGFVRVDRLEDVLPPVDVHDSRISFLTGIVRASAAREVDGEHYYKYTAQIQAALKDACNSSRVAWCDVDRALWLIGSRGCVSKRCHLCPLSDVCSVGREVKAAGVSSARSSKSSSGKLPFDRSTGVI